MNLCLRIFSAWLIETKSNRVANHYTTKYESKKRQLLGVQNLFKSLLASQYSVHVVCATSISRRRQAACHRCPLVFAFVLVGRASPQQVRGDRSRWETTKKVECVVLLGLFMYDVQALDLWNVLLCVFVVWVSGVLNDACVLDIWYVV